MLLQHSISELKSQLKSGKISAVDLVSEAIDSATEYNSQINNYITILDKKEALAEAEKADKRRSEDTSKLPLLGLPFSLKDAYITRDVTTTAASHVLKDFVPPYQATVVNKLLEAGAILIGKHNMDAWGHGGSTENTDFKPTKNPWDLERIAGGSSGGTAAAISTRSSAFAIGEDTGGSIRNPSSMCGVTGLKVSYGRVSRYGSIAYASSLDSVGPIAKSAEDIAHILEIIAGQDNRDSTSSSEKVPTYSTQLNSLDPTTKVIGLPKEFFGEGLSPEVKVLFDQARATFEKLGFKTREVSIPSLKHAISIYYLIALSETSSNLGRYDGIRYGQGREYFTEETMRRIMLGTHALSAGYADELYKNAQKARTLLITEYKQAFEKCDVLLGPITPSAPSKLGELISDPMKNLLEDMYTVTVNTVGVPSLAIPAGFTDNALPVGVQIIGKQFAELELLQIGHHYQLETDWHTQLPPVLKEKL